jgi:transcriptional regulator with XRE-family HTH domain
MKESTCEADRHGDTYMAYTNWRCRCPAAKRAWKLYKGDKSKGTLVYLRVDATGTRRRIQALMAMGWTQRDIGREMGIGHGGVSKLTKGEKVRQSNVDRVAEVYERLSCLVPPESHAAERNGWPPPMLWDDIDDQSEQPRPLPPAQGYARLDYRGKSDDPCLVDGCATGRWRAGLCARHFTVYRAEVVECGHPRCGAMVWRLEYCAHHDIGLDFAAGDWFDWAAVEQMFDGHYDRSRKPTVLEIRALVAKADSRQLPYTDLARQMGVDPTRFEYWRAAAERLHGSLAVAA